MRYKGIVIVISLLMSFHNVNAVPQIRSGHPRIFFNSETWPEIKERAYGESRASLEKLLAEVEGYPDDPVAGNTGPVVVKDRNLPIPDIVEFGREAAAAALAWRFTGKERYLVKAKKLLKVSVDAYTEATANRRPVRWYAHSRANAFCAYDWIYEALTPEERKEIIVPLVEHVEQIQRSYGLDIPRNNYGNTNSGFYGSQSLLWYSGLAAHGDGICDSLAASHLKRGYDLNCEVMQYRNDTAGDDGALASACPVYALGHYTYAQFNFMFTMLSSTGVNVAERYPRLGLLPNWIWWLWIRDSKKPGSIRSAGFGDVYHDQNVSSSARIWEQLSEFVQFYGNQSDPDMIGVTLALREFGRTREIGMNVYPVLPFVIRTDCQPQPYYQDVLEKSPLKARHFETLGQFYMRSSWMPDATYCSFTAGSVMSNHKHFDENNFTIFKYDHLALDTGDRCGERDFNLCYYYSQSVAHNVVLIHKPGEPLPNHWGIKMDDPSANENYGGMTKMTGSKVLAFETNDVFTYIASDARDCYGDKCTEAVRQFVFVYPDYFIVYDRVGAADASYAKDWLLHTKNKPVIKKNLMSAVSGNGKLFCQTLLPEDAVLEPVGGKGKEFWVRDRNYPLDPAYEERYRQDALRRGRGPYTGEWRVEVKPGGSRKDDRFLNVITAAYVDRARPVKATYLKEADRDGVRLVIEGKDVTFWFNRNGAVGGTVEYDGTSRPLADTVQKQEGYIYK